MAGQPCGFFAGQQPELAGRSAPLRADRVFPVLIAATAPSGRVPTAASCVWSLACCLPVEQHRSTMAYSLARLLVDRNSCKLDGHAPFLLFIGNQLAELGRAHRHWLAAEFGKTG